VRDALGLLPRADGGLHAFACTHGYTVIVAATNLAFRDLYEQAVAATETGKLLVVDRAPPGPSAAMPGKAPPPFYPDLLVQTPPEARITLDLQTFLMTATGDPTWPRQVNESR